jgi:Protein of unknown function (DUF2971)
MTDDEILKVFEPLWAEVQSNDSFPARRPLLAHYTSVTVLEKILNENELWFSNPLFMNDIEEVRFGMTNGANLFLTSQEIEEACKTKERANGLRASFNYFHGLFANDHVLDTYVFCLSEHQKEDGDGLLSMWRGYGGNGNGAAIVFDTAKLHAREESPFVLSNVRYGTRDERVNWLKLLITRFSEILARTDIPDEKLYLAAHCFLERLKLFALFTKHEGFKEEDEWRLVYLKDRDRQKVFEPMLSYWVGPRGVEQRLKLKIEAIPDLPETDLTLEQVVDRIILGPSLSSPLALGAIGRMFDTLGRTDLKDRIKVSTIPFRG